MLEVIVHSPAALLYGLSGMECCTGEAPDTDHVAKRNKLVEFLSKHAHEELPSTTCTK